jgi:hypothetical protein
MPYSTHFKALEARVKELRRRFLPRIFSKSGSYTDERLDGARAFRVLVHAELEHYFEARSLELADAAFDNWRINGQPSIPIACLLANIEGQRNGLPKALGTSITSVFIAGEALGQYKRCIRKNHGIRIENLLQMLLPIGILESDLDPVWLSTTDGFGAKRGETAHRTAISYVIDPRDDYQIVKQIMSGVKDVDLRLNLIRASF